MGASALRQIYQCMPDFEFGMTLALMDWTNTLMAWQDAAPFEESFELFFGAAEGAVRYQMWLATLRIGRRVNLGVPQINANSASLTNFWNCLNVTFQCALPRPVCRQRTMPNLP